MALSRPLRAPSGFGDAKKIDIDMLLLGKTGTGKSATGNSILLRKIFKSTNNSTSETKEIKSEWSEYTGKDNRSYYLKVTDGPGLEDTNVNKMQDKKRAYMNTAHFLSECPEGIHVFLLVVKMGQRFTPDDKNTVELLKEILGKDFLHQFGIIIIAGGDELNADDDTKTFHGWCREQKGELRRVMKECDNRCVLFDNRTKDKVKMKKQLETLLEVALEIISKNIGERYTNEHFKKVATSHKQLLNECSLTKIKEEFRKQLSILGGKVHTTANARDVENALGLLQTLTIQVEYEVTVTPKLKALLTDLLILKTILENAEYLIEKQKSIDSVVKQATDQCSKMITAASSPSDSTLLEILCDIAGVSSFFGSIAVAFFRGSVVPVAAGMTGSIAACLGSDGLKNYRKKNEYRY